MAERTQAVTATEVVRRDAILEAVAFAAEQLLLSPDWRDAADRVLQRLGEAAGVSRCYIVANEIDGQGRPCARQLAEWCAPGIGSQFDNPTLQSSPWAEAGFARWEERMRLGESISGSVDELPESERRELGAQDILSIAAFPVTIGDEWWGLIGFDDCVDDRAWTGVELDALRAAATVLEAAIRRHRVDDRMLRAEAEYRGFIEQIPAITYTDVIRDGRAHVGFISPQVEGLLGYPRERFIDDPDFWFSIVHPEDRERVEDQGTAVTQQGAMFDDEYRMIAADGRVVWVHDTSTEVLDEHGVTLYFQGFLIDITERKQAEERLRESEDRYRSLVDGSPDAILVHRGGRFVYANPAAAALLGADDPDRLIGVEAETIVHPDYRQIVRARIAGEERGEAAPLIREMFLTLDGREIDVEVAGIPITYEGEPAGQVVVRDITERVSAEEKLRLAEERYRLIVERAPAIVYQELPSSAGYDLDSAFVYVSPQVETILGYDAETWSTTPGFWLEVIHPDDRDLVIAESERTSASGEPYKQDYRVIAADGRVVWFHDEAVLIRDEDGRPVVWEGVMVDITERKLAEEQLAHALEVEREAAQRLRALDEMKNTFLQAVSHDLRTPLAAILGLAVTLERGDVQLAEDDSKDLARRIAGNARKLDRLVTNLLDMDRLARGIVTPKLRPTDVGSLVRRIVFESELIATSRLQADIQPVSSPSKPPRSSGSSRTSSRTPRGTRPRTPESGSPSGPRAAAR